MIYFQFIFFYINTKRRKNGWVLNLYVSSLQSQMVSHKLLISLTSVLYYMKSKENIYIVFLLIFNFLCKRYFLSLILSFFFPPFILVIFLLFSPGMFAHFFPDQIEKDNGKDLQLIIYFVCVCVLGFYVLLTMKVSGLLQVNFQTFSFRS